MAEGNLQHDFWGLVESRGWSTSWSGEYFTNRRFPLDPFDTSETLTLIRFDDAAPTS